VGSIPITRFHLAWTAGPVRMFLVVVGGYDRIFAAVAQLVERVLGKDEVLGSNPSGSFGIYSPDRTSKWES
jgi:hypothetical protein